MYNNKLFKLLKINDNDDLKKVSKLIGISLNQLKYYSKDIIIPIGDDAQKIQDYLNINELEYKIFLGDFDYDLLDKMQSNFKEIANILSISDNTEIPIPQESLVFTTNLGKLYQDDCLNVMRSMPDESVDLIFADPPFNLNKQYESNMDDKIDSERYIRWTEEWLKESVRILKTGGSIFVWNLPKWNIYSVKILSKYLTMRHWIAVDMKYGLPIQGKLYPAHYSLLYFTKGEKPKTFNPERIPLDVCKTCGHELKDYGGYKNKLNPNGINLSDVWRDIYPVKHSKYKTRGSNELPLKLLERVISLSTQEGDTVFDPFGGSGTTFIASEILNRKWIGSEIGPIDTILKRFENIEFERGQIDAIQSKKNMLFLPEIEKLRVKNNFWLPKDF